MAVCMLKSVGECPTLVHTVSHFILLLYLKLKVCGFELNVLTTIGLLVMKFGTDVHVPYEKE